MAAKKKSAKKAATPKKKSAPPAQVFALFDREGVLAGLHETLADAEGDAWGPRFRGYSVRVYVKGPVVRRSRDKEFAG